MTVKAKMVFPIALALAALAVTMMAQLTSASHPRPKGATPLLVPLVPAYDQCTSPNTTHGPSLPFGSCKPPVPGSRFLTVGTPDANGAPANSTGYIRLDVKPGAPGPPDDTALIVNATIFDVRCKSGASACGNANAADGPDYVGELQSNATIRISDHYNGPNLNEAATVQDIPFPVTMTCTNTADTSIGGSCTIDTSTQPLCPVGACNAVKDGQRTVVGITQLQVFDGGPDGVVASAGNTLFAVQGIFFP
jgi:hypothetical protein